MPGHGLSVIVTINAPATAGISRFSMQGEGGATADEARLLVRDVIHVEPGLTGSDHALAPGLQKTLWLPVVDSIPSTLSPCEAFMFSMSQWQGKSRNGHNID